MHIPQQIILLLVILISGGTVAIAQDNMPSVQNSPHVKLGLKTGVNISGAYNIQGEDLTTKPRPGFTTGLFVNIPLGGRLDFQPEIAYAQRGIRATGTMFSGPYDLTRTTNYIDVSTLLAIKATDILSLTVGPQASFLTRQRDVFSDATTPAQREEFRHDNVRKMTVSLVAGPQFNVSPFVLDARLGWDLLRNTKAVERLTPRYSYIWYQFTLGFRFR
jgi:hypothetical protein